MVNIVTFFNNLGGDGLTVTDDDDPVTGLANGGHLLRFVRCLSNMISVAGYTVTQCGLAVNASAAAQAAQLLAQQAAAGAIAISLDVPTGQPSIMPSLLLDFANSEQVDARVAFTRASTGTRVNKYGLIESVPANVPRIDYDPVSLVCKGLLIEEQRSNLLTYSEQIDNAAWIKSACSISANAVLSPDGSVTMDKITEDSNTAEHYVLQVSASHTSGIAVTGTVFVKAAERTKVRLRIQDGANGCYCDADLAAGTITGYANFGTGTGVSAAIVPLGNGIYRISVSGVPGSSSTTNLLVQSLNNSGSTTYAGDGVSGVYIWGSQVEAGPFATSYIPTTSVAATRSAEIATITSTDFSRVYNANEGCFVSVTDQLIAGSAGKQYTAFEAGDGTSNNIIQVGTQYDLTNFQLLINTSGVSQAVLLDTAVTTKAKRALSYKSNDIATSLNGAAVKTDASATMPTVTGLSIGCRLLGTQQLNGHVQLIAYYPKRLVNTEIQAVTS